MSGPNNPALVPTEIKLRRKSRELEIAFTGGERFKLPCEYLRVFAPAAEARALRDNHQFVVGKQGVNISDINPVGGLVSTPCSVSDRVPVTAARDRPRHSNAGRRPR